MNLYTFKNKNFEIQYDPKYHNLVLDGEHKYNKDIPSDPFPKRSDVKVTKPRFIRISIGTACNMNCSYCLQTAMVPDKKKQKSDALDLVERLKVLDLSELQTLELWGGEPLLYWRFIKTFLTALNFKGKFNLVTNGTKLTMEHINWMEQYGGVWTLAVSHDGPYHDMLRGEDCLQNPKTKEVLDYLSKDNGNINAPISVCFSTVVGEHSWDVYRTDKYLHHFYPKIPIMFQLSTAHDEHSATFVLNKNLDKYVKSIEKLIRENKANNRPLDNNYYGFLMGIDSIKDNFKYHNENPFYYSCGLNMDDTISIDIKGNIIACHNAGSDPELFYGHINNIEQANLTKVMDTSVVDSCSTCLVSRMCRQVCPIVERNTEHFKLNCNSHWALYAKLLSLAISDVFEQDELMELVRDERTKHRPLL